MSIYEAVKKIAEEKGLSIPVIEKKAGLANGAIGKWRESVPKVDNLKAVADVLEVSIEELI